MRLCYPVSDDSREGSMIPPQNIAAASLATSISVSSVTCLKLSHQQVVSRHHVGTSHINLDCWASVKLVMTQLLLKPFIK